MKNHQPQLVNKDNSMDATTRLVNKAARLADAGQCDEAFRLLLSGSSASQAVQNARGVCLLRQGQANEAVRVLRSLVLPLGCTWMKAELPVIYRTNFATALWLAKLPHGARDALGEMAEQDHPSVIRLHEALGRWEQSLSWWQRIHLRLGLVPDAAIAVDFTPGEFVDPSKSAPPPNSPASSKQPAQQVA